MGSRAGNGEWGWEWGVGLGMGSRAGNGEWGREWGVGQGMYVCRDKTFMITGRFFMLSNLHLYMSFLYVMYILSSPNSFGTAETGQRGIG